MFGIRFTYAQKEAHYKGLVNGSVKPKENSKYTAGEQISYARGQVDRINEARRSYAYKNASAEKRQTYKEAQAKKREDYKASKGSYAQSDMFK